MSIFVKLLSLQKESFNIHPTPHEQSLLIGWEDIPKLKCTCSLHNFHAKYTEMNSP